MEEVLLGSAGMRPCYDSSREGLEAQRGISLHPLVWIFLVSTPCCATCQPVCIQARQPEVE